MNAIIIFFLIINFFNNTYSADHTENKKKIPKYLSGIKIKKPKKNYSNYKKYSEENKKDVSFLLSQGISRKEIAKELNINIKTIYSWFKNKKYSEEDKKDVFFLLSQDLSKKEIAEELNINAKTINNWINNKKKLQKPL